jgi:hypothetical protein
MKRDHRLHPLARPAADLSPKAAIFPAYLIIRFFGAGATAPVFFATIV